MIAWTTSAISVMQYCAIITNRYRDVISVSRHDVISVSRHDVISVSRHDVISMSGHDVSRIQILRSDDSSLGLASVMLHNRRQTYDSSLAWLHFFVTVALSLCLCHSLA